MSQENVEFACGFYAVVTDLYDRTEALHLAHETGDFGEFLPGLEELIDPEAVLRTPEGSMFPEAGTKEWHGREGLMRFMVGQTDGFKEMWIKPHEYIDAGDRVVVPLRFGGRARHTGIEVEFDVVHVLTIRERRLSRLDIYLNKAEAVKAAGLSELR